MPDEDEDPTVDEDKAELEALRKEKADAKAAADKARDDELASLKKYREDNEAAKVRAPKAPKTKTEKEADKEPDKDKDKEEEPPKRTHSASRRWFG